MFCTFVFTFSYCTNIWEITTRKTLQSFCLRVKPMNRLTTILFLDMKFPLLCHLFSVHSIKSVAYQTSAISTSVVDFCFIPSIQPVKTEAHQGFFVGGTTQWNEILFKWTRIISTHVSPLFLCMWKEKISLSASSDISTCERNYHFAHSIKSLMYSFLRKAYFVPIMLDIKIEIQYVVPENG